MPNFFSAFTTDVFRPLATLLIPGAIGISTWFVALPWHFPALRDLAARDHTDTGFVLLFVTVFAGMVLEDFGARWEVQLDHWADSRTANQHTKDWCFYLQTVFKSDPVGRRYARALVDHVAKIEPKVVLIDGRLLAGLMIDFNVGVTPVSVYETKSIDSDYFSEE